ncbi:hypothetical protein [Methylomagnum sp.]
MGHISQQSRLPFGDADLLIAALGNIEAVKNKHLESPDLYQRLEVIHQAVAGLIIEAIKPAPQKVENNIVPFRRGRK